MAPEEDDANLTAIRKQVEFYFSDSNLPRDRFLLAKTEEDPLGFVPLSTLLTFNRLKKMGVASVEMLSAALKSSTLLVLDDTKTKVRRSNPLPKESMFPTRAVHLKGWVPGGPEPDLDHLHKLFSPSGTVLSIKIRRWKDDAGAKHFRGSIFVEMDSPEAAERVAAENYEVEIDVNGQKESKVLLAELYFDWVERKKKEREERKLRAKAKYASLKNKSKDNVNEQSGSAHENAATKSEEGAEIHAGSALKTEAKLKGEPQENSAVQLGAEKAIEHETKPDIKPEIKPGVKTEVMRESGVDDGKVDNELTVKEENPERTFIPGLVLRYEGIGEDATREDIRDAMEEFGNIAFVDFFSGQTEGNVRFSTPDETKSALEGLTNSGKLLAGKKPTLRILDSEEEKEYWQVAWIKMDSFRKRRREDRSSGSYGKGHKRFRGGGRYHGGRGKRNNRDNRGPRKNA